MLSAQDSPQMGYPDETDVSRAVGRRGRLEEGVENQFFDESYNEGESGSIICFKRFGAIFRRGDLL